MLNSKIKIKESEKKFEDEYNKYSKADDWEEYSRNNINSLNGYDINNSIHNSNSYSADGIYNFINLKKEYQDLSPNLHSPNNDSELMKFQSMSDDEIKTYNYIYKKYGDDKALKYIDDITPVLNYRMTLKTEENAMEFANEHPVLGSVASVGTNILSALNSKPVVNAIKSAITGDDIDTNSSEYLAQRATNALRNQVASDIDSDVGRFIYQTASSVVDDAIRIAMATALTGGVGAVGEAVGSNALASAPKYTAKLTSALMGNSVATNAIIEGKEKGYSDVKVVTLGIIQGAIESITEKYSIDRIIKNPNLLKSAVTEGTEEFASNWMNKIVDAIANGNKNELSQAVKQYKEDNPDATDSSAFSHVIFNSLGEDILAFLGGAMAGGAMGGVQQGFNYAQTSSTGKDIKNLNNVDTLVEIGSNLDTNSKAYKTANKISEKISNNKSVSNNLVGKLRNEIINETQQASNDDLNTAIENRLVTLGEKSAKAKYLSNVAVKVINGESLSTEEKVALGGSTQAQRVISEYNNSDKSNYTNEWSNNLQSKARTFNAMANSSNSVSIPANEISNISSKINERVISTLPEQQQTARKKVQINGRTVDTVNNKGVKIKGIDSVKNGVVTFSLANGETVSAEEVELSDDNELLTAYATTMPTAEAQAYYDNYTGGDVDNYTMQWNLAKSYGRAGTPESRFNLSLDDSQFLSAYKIGAIESSETAKTKQSKINTAVIQFNKQGMVYKKGSVNTSAIQGLTGQLTQRQKDGLKATKAISKVLGIDVEIFSSKTKDGQFIGENGSFNPETGKIRIDINAGANEISKLATDSAMLRTFSHELTHFIQNYSPALYNELKGYVLDTLERQGKNVVELAESKMAMSKTELSYENSIDEVVADACEMMIKDSKAIKDIANNNKRLATKIKEFIADFISKIKKAFNGVKANSVEAKAIQSSITDFENIQKLWDNALVEATEGYHAVSSVKETFANKETTSIKLQDRNKYPYNMQTVIDGYLNGIDKDLVKFYDDNLNVSKSKKGINRYTISQVNERESKRLKEITGSEVAGFTHNINENCVRHIFNRHGSNGKNDHSMALSDDVGRMGWVISNYDSLDILLDQNGKQRFSVEFADKDNNKAPLVVYKKKINGVYYLVEAVFENKYKKLWVVSAYIKKEAESFTQESNANALDTTPEATPDSQLSAYNNIIEENDKNSNSNTNQNPNIDMNHSQRDISYRELLATALQTMSEEGSPEYKKFERYIDNLYKIESYEQELEEVNAKISTEYKKSTINKSVLAELQRKKKNLGDKITKLDKVLLSAEAEKPLRELIARERKNLRSNIGKARREKAEISQLKRSCRVRIDRLTRKLLANKKNNNVPDVVKSIYTGLLDYIDPSSKKLLKDKGQTVYDAKFNELKKKLNTDKITLNENGMITYEQNGKTIVDKSLTTMPETFIDDLRVLVNEIADIAEAYLNNSTENVIEKMNKQQLKDLRDTLAVLYKSANNAGKFFTNGKYTRVADCIKDTTKHLENMGKKKNLTKGQKAYNDIMDGLLVKKTLTPIYYMDRFGKGGQSIMNELMDGVDKFSLRIKEIIDYINNVFGDEKSKSKKIKEWQETVHTFDLADGELKINVPMIMSLYCLSKREQAVKHLLVGGITLSGIDSKGKYNPKSKEKSTYHITETDLTTICNSLTNEQKKVADKIQKFLSEDCSEWGNEISLIRHGIRMFEEKNYFPIETDDNTRSKETKNQNKSIWSLLNKSWTKKTVPNANNRVVISDIFDVYNKHSTEVAKYNSLGLAIQDANTWFETVDVTRLDNGKLVTKSVKEEAEKAYGKNFVEYFENLLYDIDGGIENNRKEGLFNKVVSLQKASKVMFNLRVALLQPTAYYRALGVIDGKYLNKSVKDVKKLKTLIKEMQSTGIGYWKSLGFFDNNTTYGVSEIVKGSKSLYSKIADIGMYGAEMGDKITWAYLYNACKYEATDSGYKECTEDFTNHVNKRFREIVYRTQVVDNIMTRSEIMRSDETSAKFLTPFMSEPTLSLNVALGCSTKYLDALREGKSPKVALKLYGKPIKKALTGLFISLLSSSLFEALIDTMRYDDNDKTSVEQFTDNFLQNAEKNINPLNQIPYVKDCWNLLKSVMQKASGADANYYETTDFYSDTFNTIWDFYEKTMGDDSEDTTAYGKLHYSLRVLSLSGIGVANLERDMVAIYNATIGNATGRRLLAWQEYNSQKAKRYDKAIESGNNDVANSILTEMKESEKAKYENMLNTSNSAIENGKYRKYTSQEAEYKAFESVRNTFFKLYKEKYIEAYKNNDTKEMENIRKRMILTGTMRWKGNETLDSKLKDIITDVDRGLY